MAASKNRVIHWPLEVDDRLKELGLNRESLWQAIQAGINYKASLTQFNTNAVKGIGVWDAIHRALGEQVCADKWIRQEPGNFAYMMHPSENWGVAVLAGDKGTGLSDPQVSNQSPFSGRARKRTRQAIRQNEVVTGWQTHIAQENTKAWQGIMPIPILTYFLVHHIDLNSETVCAELSLPVRLTASGDYISAWAERILLPPPDTYNVAQRGHSPITLPSAEDQFTVEITKKAV